MLKCLAKCGILTEEECEAIIIDGSKFYTYQI